MEPNYVEEILKHKDSLIEQLSWALGILVGAIGVVWGAMMYSWKLGKKNTENLIKALEEGHKTESLMAEAMGKLSTDHKLTDMKIENLQKTCDEIRTQKRKS